MTDGPLSLRPYQVPIVEEIKSLLSEQPSLLCTAPTGSGKTVMFSEIMARVYRRGLTAAVLVHRQELVKQSEAAITKQAGCEPGVVWQGRKEWDNTLLVIAQDTLATATIPPNLRIHLLVIDEAHHSAAPGWLNTINRLRPRYLLGFSATPFRQDKEPLSPYPFAKVIRPLTPADLIAQGHLCAVTIESPVIHDRNAQPQAINQASNLEHIYQQAIAYAVANGRSKIILYVSGSRAHSPVEIIKRTTEALRQNGITADGISQDISAGQRDVAIRRFRATPGASVLVNYQALTEGTDVPEVDCVVIGRHTTSESTIIQMIGRGLRTHPRKEDCLVLDYTGRRDMSDIIHYWRIDEPAEEGAYSPKQKEPDLTKPELSELITNFPKQLNPIESTRGQYPWFRPFENRPMLAMATWTPADKVGTYITVEPAKQGLWKFSKISLNKKGPTPLTRQQSVVASADNAATLVKMALGEHAPYLERGAPWRLRPASNAQKQAWKKLHPTIQPDLTSITAGEVSDAIAKRRFQLRVNPSIL